ncbi:hypothetical protein [Actinomadura sp. NEAU-AAG7]|uniref:hypothetical protein n=1 Tax=Actinomadura sp. NEAU-AAG7 TaxID=2839640 RepID=UPI001BE41F9C|nr:hypothetical protein [Actinomadura sp. NEAU-AAG7]MBT2214105.1 hypothetical protein [Actinomadura sp. NEAU-AAG7]
MTSIMFPVPSSTTSRFAVAADHIPHDLAGAARSRIVAFSPHLAGRLGTPQLTLQRETLADLRWDPARITAVHPGQRRAQWAFHQAAEFAVVTSTAPVTDQPRGAQVARAAAHALADATGGVVADLVTGHILSPPRTERTSFVLADQWLGDALPPFRANGRCTAADPEHDPEGVNGCSCVRLRTCGLRRFGLPELQITDVACPHDLVALNVLRTTARHLLTDHWHWLATGPADQTRTITAARHLTESDFNDFWGSTREPRTHPSAFEAHLTPITPRLWSVAPPPTFDGTTNDWLWGDTLPTSLHDVLSSPADPPFPQAA